MSNIQEEKYVGEIGDEGTYNDGWSWSALLQKHPNGDRVRTTKYWKQRIGSGGIFRVADFHRRTHKT